MIVDVLHPSDELSEIYFYFLVVERFMVEYVGGTVVDDFLYFLKVALENK